MRFDNLAHQHNHHQTDFGFWAYRGTDNQWKPFANDKHFANTVESGEWEVRFFTVVHDMPLPAEVL
jgi:hypothetical protein